MHVGTGTHRKQIEGPSVKRIFESDVSSTAKCKQARCDLMKFGQDLNTIHVAEILSQPNVMATVRPLGLTRGLGFRHVAQLLEPERSSGHRAFLDVFARTERPMLVGGSPKCKAFMEMQLMGQTDLEC